jgi:hypothetical protein
MSVKEYPRKGRLFETAGRHFMARSMVVCPTKGTDWGGYNIEFRVIGDTEEKAKAKLEDKIKAECVEGCYISEWVKDNYCPSMHNHHIGSTCGVCGQKD